MKTILIEQPGKIRISETAMPKPKEGEALLKIRYCGICGADVASYTGNQPFTTYPRIPGHEFSAEIVSIPENPLGLKAGDVVTANPYFNCGSCYSCQRGYVNCCTDNQTMGVQRDGSFCEYVAMPIERKWYFRTRMDAWFSSWSGWRISVPLIISVWKWQSISAVKKKDADWQKSIYLTEQSFLDWEPPECLSEI